MDSQRDWAHLLAGHVTSPFVGALARIGAHKNARFVCQPMRELIDCSMKALTVRLQPSDAHFWAAGGERSLKRWPNSESITLDLGEDFPDMEQLSATVVLPFTELPEVHRKRIHSIKIKGSCKCGHWEAVFMDRAVQCLAELLPELRVLDLWEMRGASITLAGVALPHLQELVLPTPDALASDALPSFTNLTRLFITDVQEMTLQQVNCLAKLRKLTHLQLLGKLYNDGAVVVCGNDSAANIGTVPQGKVALQQLLNNVPASLEELVVNVNLKLEKDTDVIRDVVMRFKEGHLQEIAIGGQVHLSFLNSLAAHVLTSRAFPPEGKKLELLHLYWLMPDVLLRESALHTLKQLLLRCNRLEVEMQSAGGGTLRIIELLGLPWTLQTSSVQLRLRDEQQQGPAAGGGRVAAAADDDISPPGPQPLPATLIPPDEFFAQKVLWRLAGASSTNSPDETAASEPSEEEEEDRPRKRRKISNDSYQDAPSADGPSWLILKGHWIANLVAEGRSALHNTMESLWHRAGGDNKLLAYQTLPVPTAGIMVAVDRQKGGAAAVATAAKALADEAEGHLQVLQVDAQLEKEMWETLEAEAWAESGMRVGYQPEVDDMWRCWKLTDCGVMQRLYLSALQKELQALWDSRDTLHLDGLENTAGVAERERELLRQLLRLDRRLGCKRFARG